MHHVIREDNPSFARDCWPLKRVPTTNLGEVSLRGGDYEKGGPFETKQVAQRATPQRFIGIDLFNTAIYGQRAQP